jgi:23S rRNA pseudouridine1911/1915/1917 synthase
MVVAKTNEAHAALADLFANAKETLIKRSYTCFVLGKPRQSRGEIRTFIRRNPNKRQEYIASDTIGKKAITLYEVQRTVHIPTQTNQCISIIGCRLLTGRTHQIRVHMKHIGCPIIGDQVYGGTKVIKMYPDVVRDFSRQALHSRRLHLIHPLTHENLEFESSLPDDMQHILETIENLL